MSAIGGVSARRRIQPRALVDYGLLLCVLALIGFGVVVLASASMPLAGRDHDDPFYYLFRHGFALGLALAVGVAAFAVPAAWWQRAGLPLLLLGLVLLALVLVPGIGHTANGATRWIPLGPLNLQVSELMKLLIIVYLAGYLVRHEEAVRTRPAGFLRPMLLIGLVGALIMAQPDFGTTAVIMATALALLFLGGVPLRYFLILAVLIGVVMAVLVVVEPYRLERLLCFRDPFAEPYDCGYQLSQSLIAFGRGEWLGVGLGNGIQKQFFLPEPHTDFIAAVIGEELGLMGILALLAGYTFITWRALTIGGRALSEDDRFSAFVAYGIGLSIALQAFVNLGVSLGILPTKGLTLPFVSYGSNSLIVGCMAIALLLRIDRGHRRRALELGSGRGLRWVRA